LLTIVLLAGAGVVGWVNWRYGQLQRYHVNLRKAAAGEPENYLITGSDSRKGIVKGSKDAGAFLNGTYDAGQRSDSIMILRVDPAQKTARVLSIPRDLFVSYAPSNGKGNGRGKINGAFAISPQVLTDTISTTFGISINHFMQVDFVGFKRLVDAIGGLPVYFDTAMRDRNTGLDVEQPGCVKLDGDMALAFARSRHLQYQNSHGRWVSDEANDFGRIKRQQFLMRHAIARLNSQGYLTHPAELDHLASAFVATVTVDQGFSLGTLKSLADRFQSFDAEHLKSYTVPATRWYPAPDGSDALKIDQAAAQPILNMFRNHDEQQSSASFLSVGVYNGTGQAGQASNVAGALEKVGFGVTSVGNAATLGYSQIQSHTMIRYAPDDRAQADLLARSLTVVPQLVPDSRQTEGTVALITGTDFTTVEAHPRAATTGGAASSASTVAPDATSTTAGGLGGSGSESSSSSTSSSSTTTTSTTVLGRVPPDTAPAGVSCS
jgi:LCP family protein required for cell wall assembly